MRKSGIALLLSTLLLGALPAAAEPPADCLVGAYRSPAGDVIVLTHSNNSTLPEALAYVRLDGHNGRFEEAGSGQMVASATAGDVSSQPGWMRFQGCDGGLRLRFGG